MRAGAFALGLKPAEFWRLSLAEWQALAQTRASAVPSVGELKELMRAHPDARESEG